MTRATIGPSPLRQAARAARAALGGTLPPRYAEYSTRWRADFKDLAAPTLISGATVLDVGAGRRPVFTPEERPDGVSYVGLDVVRSELDAAPEGSYGEKITADATRRLTALDGRFDLVVSWQVLEHVTTVSAALDNFRAYLKPGGIAVISLSGRYSLFGLLNMVIPQRLGVQLVAQVMRRDPDTVFPAYYDECYHAALGRLAQAWSSATIISLWNGAAYFQTIRPVLAVYIFFEQWAVASDRANLATHYFLLLRK